MIDLLDTYNYVAINSGEQRNRSLFSRREHNSLVKTQHIKEVKCFITVEQSQKYSHNDILDTYS